MISEIRASMSVVSAEVNAAELCSEVLFTPNARLEFRITEFSWRDIPYFMYKRGEVPCHQTRDYIATKSASQIRIFEDSEG